jgi:hypothetical protein
MTAQQRVPTGFFADREREFAAACKGMSDAELRRAFSEAGQAFEYYGGHWTYGIVRAEMKARGVL